MDYDITLVLREEYLKTDAIVLESVKHDPAHPEVLDEYRREDGSALIIQVHEDTGEVLQIFIEHFTKETEYAIKMLREYPLPWTFSLPSMKLKEKPLEDVLLAVYKKNKDAKMSWE